MTASPELGRTLGVLLDRADGKTVAAFTDAIAAEDVIAYSDFGPVGGTLNVFFTIFGTPVSNDMKPYVVTTGGLYVGYQAKAGFLKTAPAVWKLPRTDIRGGQRHMIHDRGDVKRVLELHGPSGMVASLFTLQLAGSSTGFAKDAIRGICQGLGLPADPSVDF